MIKENELFKRKTTVLLAALICCLLWGAGYPCVKIGYDLFRIEASDTISKSLFAGIRFAVAGVLAILYAGIRKKKVVLPLRGEVKGILMLSVFQTILQYMFIYVGLANTQGSKGSILNQIGAFLLIIVTPFIYKSENVTVQKVIGCILGFSGIIIINLNGNLDMSLRIMGEGFVILSSVCAAVGYVIGKKVSQNGDAVIITGYQQLLGGIVMIIAGFAWGGHIQPMGARAIALLLFLSFSVAVAYILWMLLLKYNEVSKIAIYKFGVPIFGVLFSGMLLGENVLNIRNVISLILVSFGIFMVNYNEA